MRVRPFGDDTIKATKTGLTAFGLLDVSPFRRAKRLEPWLWGFIADILSFTPLRISEHLNRGKAGPRKVG